MPLYELFCLARPQLPRAKLAGIIRTAGTTVLDNGGVLRSITSFGDEILAYDIRKSGQKFDQVGWGSSCAAPPSCSMIWGMVSAALDCSCLAVLALLAQDLLLQSGASPAVPTGALVLLLMMAHLEAGIADACSADLYAGGDVADDLQGCPQRATCPRPQPASGRAGELGHRLQVSTWGLLDHWGGVGAGGLLPVFMQNWHVGCSCWPFPGESH